jgi:hypothetical protein
MADIVTVVAFGQQPSRFILAGFASPTSGSRYDGHGAFARSGRNRKCGSVCQQSRLSDGPYEVPALKTLPD